MNQISRFSVCRSSSFLRKIPCTRWSSSKPISSSSSSLISNNSNPSSSSNLLRRLVISNPYLPPPQNAGNHVRKFSREAAEECNFDENYLNDEIWEIKNDIIDAQCSIESHTGPPLDAVKILADKFNAFMEKLALDDDEKDYPDHLKEIKNEIEDIEYEADMTMAFGEYVAAGGSASWQPFHDEWRMLMEGGEESREEHNQKILASLHQMTIRSNMMKRLMKEYELRQNQNHNQQ